MPSKSFKDFTPSDRERYYVSQESYLPFIDTHGRKRVARIIGVHESGIVRYRSVLLSRWELSKSYYEQPARNFIDNGVLPSKYVIGKRGTIYYVYASCIRDMHKGLSPLSYVVVDLDDGEKTSLYDNHLLTWEFFWGECLTTRLDCTLEEGKLTYKGRKYIYGLII